MNAIPLMCYRRRSYERIYLDHPASPEMQLHNLEQIADETGLPPSEVEDRLRGFLYMPTPAREIPRGIQIRYHEPASHGGGVWLVQPPLPALPVERRAFPVERAEEINREPCFGEEMHKCLNR